MLKRLTPHLNAGALTVSGETMGEIAEAGQVYDDDVIRPLNDPIYAEGATAILRGNLAPNGCVMKPAASEQRFLKHTGPAIAFESYAEMKKEIDRDDLDVTPDHVIVLKNAGPQGGPGMPEWGMLPIPKKLVKAGVRDMLRISDARMSGTSYGACILHVAPEAYVGGPLALVRTGDMITVDVPARAIRLEVSDAELGQPPRRLDAAAARVTSAASAGSRPSTSARPTKAATSISSRRASARRWRSRQFTDHLSRTETSAKLARAESTPARAPRRTPALKKGEEGTPKNGSLGRPACGVPAVLSPRPHRTGRFQPPRPPLFGTLCGATPCGMAFGVPKRPMGAPGS